MAKSKKQLVPRTRASNTMTEAEFWSMIRSALRQKSRWWKPISLVKQKARRAYKGTNKRQKWEYQCSQCEKWHPDSNIEVDHIIPAGTLRCYDDLKGFVERLFCEEDNLRVLCKPCHKEVTKEQRENKD